MEDVRYSPYKQNAFMTAVRKGKIVKVRSIITTRGLCYAEQWKGGYSLLRTAVGKKHTKIAELLLTNGSEVNSSHKYPCNSPLHFAVRNGDIGMVQLLLDKGANINAKNIQGKTPLHNAVKHKRTEIIVMLLNRGANVDAADKSSVTPLHIAVQRQSKEITTLLLSRGANVDGKRNNAITSHNVAADRGDDSTPLHIALRNCNQEITKMLLSSGANVNAETNTGNTPLHIATRKGNLQIIEDLLKHGARVNSVITSIPWGNSNTALHIAIESGMTTVTSLLLSNGANVNAPANDGKTPLHMAAEYGHLTIVEHLLNHGAQVNSVYASTYYNSHTPLHFAVDARHKAIVELLLSRGADADAKRTDGTTLLHLATLYEYLEIVELLLKHGASVNSVSTFMNRGGETSLDIAVRSGNEAITELLLSRGADVDVKRTDGTTSLHLATPYEYLEIGKLFLKHGASVNSACTSMNREDEPSFHVAVRSGNEAITELLLRYGVDVNAKGIDGRTALHAAVEIENSRIVEQLLKHAADINSTNQNGHTPLYLAVERRCEKIVKLLLESGAYVNAEDKNDKSILHLAVEKGSPIIVEHILKHRPDLNDKRNSSVVNAAVQGYKTGSIKIIADLLEYGFTVKPEDANNCMHVAVRNGFVQIVDEILKHGADVNKLYNATCGKGSIPIHLAVNCRKVEMAKLLISYGADVNAPDETGRTPIFYVIVTADLKMAKLLLTNNANIKDNPELLNIAVELDRREIVEVLLQHGADVNAVDESGKRPIDFIVPDGKLRYFDISCTNHDSEGELAKLLLSWGANTNAVVENSLTVLHAAADKGYVEVVEALLEYNANVNSTDEGGTTPLHLSAQRGNTVITEMLLNQGADINAEDCNGTTALHFATQRGYEGVVEVLLKRGAKVNATMKCDLITPLHLAAESGYLNIAKLLLKFGGKVDSTHDRHVLTPLHKAALNGHIEIVELLLKFGAAVDCTDKHGTTALHIASQIGHEDVVTALLEHGSDITMKNKADYTALCFVVDGIGSNRSYDYNRDFISNYDADYEIRTYVTIARILRHHVVKMRAANLYTYSSDYDELYDFENYEEMYYTTYSSIDREKCRLSRNNFQSECEKEIESMKIEKFVNANITFYDVLTKDVKQLAMYARNENIVEAFGSGEYKKKFPIYSGLIYNNFRKGEKRKEFLEQGNKILDLLFNDFKKLPRDCTERILGYLNDDDVRALTDASKPAANCQQS